MIAAVVIVLGLAAIAYTLVRTHDTQFDRAPEDPAAADRLFMRSIALLGVASALVVNGVLQLALLALRGLPHTIDTPRLWLLAGAAGVAATLALMGLAGVLLRRSHRTFRALAEIATIGLIGACTTAFVELDRYNREADTSAPEFVEVTVSSGGYLGAAPDGAIQLHDTTGTGWPSVALGVSGPTGRTLKRGVRAVVEQRAGALGVRWISAVKPGTSVDNGGRASR